MVISWPFRDRDLWGLVWRCPAVRFLDLMEGTIRGFQWDLLGYRRGVAPGCPKSFPSSSRHSFPTCFPNGFQEVVTGLFEVLEGALDFRLSF
jgi:hypothetical protein